ncbi:MAG: hypothetical protein WCX16_04670 [Candidatus Omnitrophota bacterium]
MKKLLFAICCICLFLITILLSYQIVYIPWKKEADIQKSKELERKFRACVWERLEDRVSRKVGFLGETREKDKAITEEVCDGCMTKVGIMPSEEVYDLYFSIRDEFREDVRVRILEAYY